MDFGGFMANSTRIPAFYGTPCRYKLISSYHQVRLQYPDGGDCHPDGRRQNQDQSERVQHRGVPGGLARHEAGKIPTRVRTLRQRGQPSGEVVVCTGILDYSVYP